MNFRLRDRLADAVYRALAAGSRTTPLFRGKWYLVRAAHRAIGPWALAGNPHAVVTLRFGVRLRLDRRDLSEATLYWLGIYEPHLDRVLRRALNPDAVVVDVGANIGVWALQLARIASAPAGHVYAVEPIPANAARLRQHVVDNGLEAKVTIIGVALGRAAGIASMWLKTSVTGADTGTAAIAPAGDGHLEVPLQTADVAFAGATRCDLLMLDVDGGEFDVLAGAERFIATTRPAILAELDEYWLSLHGQRRDEILSWAERHSYHAHVIHRDGRATPIVAGAVPDGDLLVLPKEWPSERIRRWTGAGATLMR